MRLVKNGRKIQHELKQLAMALTNIRRYASEVEIDAINLAKVLGQPVATINGNHRTDTGTMPLMADIYHPTVTKVTPTKGRGPGRPATTAVALRNLMSRSGSIWKPETVAYKLGINRANAVQALRNAVNKGWARRISVGRYTIKN